MTPSVNMSYSVVMAVYAKDRSEWLDLAFESVVNQTVISNDIIIVVDGPVGDNLDTKLKNYDTHDFVNIIRLDRNQGLGNALNVGMKHAKNELIGRMDADDICAPNRFELQLAEFNKNLSLDILGGQVAEFVNNPDEIISYRKVPTNSKEIRQFSRRRSPFNHPTVMYKKTVIEKLGGYDVSAIRIEDYDLWLRAIHSGAQVANLDQILLQYRQNEDTTKRRKTFNSLRNHVRARARFYSNGYISKSDLAYGIITQTTLFALPTQLVDKVFKRMVRK